MISYDTAQALANSVQELLHALSPNCTWYEGKKVEMEERARLALNGFSEEVESNYGD